MLSVLFFLISFSVKAQIISTFAGSGSTSYSGSGIPATSAGMPDPCSGAFDKDGNYYFADAIGSHRVRKIDVSGTITTLAGNGTGAYTSDGVPATSSSLNIPWAIAMDTLQNLYIADAQNSRIRKVNLTSGLITTVAGTGIGGYSGDSTSATTAKIWNPNDVCLDKNGNIYIADLYNQRVRKVDVHGIITTFAGSGSTIGDGGPASSALLSTPQGLAVDSSGDIYIADAGLCRVRKVDVATGLISTVAGSSPGSYTGDNIPATTAIINPIKLAFDLSNNLIIADKYNKRVFKVDNMGIIHCIAGNGSAGFSGDGGAATSAAMDYPAGLAVDACGNIYVPCVNNRRIRKITYPSNPSISISVPAIATIGSSVSATATLANAGRNYSIMWYNNGVLFATTTTTTVTYTKAQCTDSLTALVYGCGDSAVSNLKVVACNVGVASTVHPHRGVTCYPNPVEDELHIEAGEVIESVVILDLLGREVLKNEYRSSGSSLKIGMDSLPKGMYVVRVNGVYVQRVVKE